jgi:hypothetical protein
MYETKFTITVDNENPIGLEYVLIGYIQSTEISLSDSYVSLTTDGTKEWELP